MVHCISKKSIYNREDLAQFERIQQHFGWSDAVAEAKIGTWMSLHDSREEFPTIKEMTQYEESSKIYSSQERAINGQQNARLKEMLNNEYEKEIPLQTIVDEFLSNSPYADFVKAYLGDIALDGITFKLTSGINGGYYSSDFRTIRLDAYTAFTNGDPSTIIMHEIMHALTIDRLNKYPKYKKRFLEILKEYREKSSAFANRYNKSEWSEDEAIKEFVADCWTNPATIKELSEIKSDKQADVTLWDKIKSLFNDIFKPKEGSLLENTAVGITELLNQPLTYRDFTDRGSYHSQENVATSSQQMRQTWTPQVIQYRAARLSHIFRSIVDNLERELPEVEQLPTSSATRKYIITARYGAGNILKRVREEIEATFANKDWVTDYVHDMYEESAWGTEKCNSEIDRICSQGQLMLDYFEPLCIEASEEIKRLEGVSILTSDGEVIDLTDDELLTDEEVQTKHEEGWFYNAHEQSLEETLESETVSILSNLYETDSEGNYTNFDDLYQPIPLNFNMVLATTSQIVGNCTLDAQMIPSLNKNVAKYPWMRQIVDMLLGQDTETSRLYENLSDEDIRLKTMSLQAIFWKDMHHIYVNIAEQVENTDESDDSTSDKKPIICRIVNRKEGQEALLRQFENNCYNNQTLFNDQHKPYKAVYRADGSFNEANYSALHEEISKSNLFYSIPSMNVTEADIDLIDRALKSFGVDIPISNIRRLFDTSAGVTPNQKENVENLKSVIFGFYAANPATNQPLQSVKSSTEAANIFDAFRQNYNTLATIFGDESMGYEESTGRLTVDNEDKSLFSRILPNPIHTIVNKLKNIENLSEANYQARLQRDYGKNWWFASKRDDSGNGIFRLGLLRDLATTAAVRSGLRLKTLKASKGISYSQEIDAQAEETRLNEFENTTRTVQGITFKDYSVPTFSDTGESYYMSMRYFNVKDATQKKELVSRLCDVIRQEIDRINVVEARAKVNADAIAEGQEPPIKPIACWDIEFKDGKRVDSKKDGSNFHFFSTLNDSKKAFLESYQKLSNDPAAQQQLLERAVEWAMNEEFQFYVDQFNQWQVNSLPQSQHAENIKSRAQMIDFIESNRETLPLTAEQKVIIDNIVNKRLLFDTLTQDDFDNIKATIYGIFENYAPNQEWLTNFKLTLDSFKLDTKNLDKLEDYFWNSFYANTQIFNITMRDPAFLGTADKMQKRYKMFYSPVATCYTTHYMYDENGDIKLQEDGLTKDTEYSLILKDDIIAQAPSFENVKAAIEKRVTDRYLTREQANEILDNMKKINVADAQCYRTLPSWQKCLNMIGKGYNKKMQKSINRLMNPEKYGEWSYEDYHNVWEIFKPFVSSYSKVESGLSEETQFNSQYESVEVPVMHKNAEFLMLAMYTQLSGVAKDNWRLKALNEFMVKHGIDKAQFESAVKVGGQAPIDLNQCTTPEEIIATLEATTKLTGELQADEGDQQVVHSIPFRDWGISTSMPEHLLDHEESSMGTQLLKIIMEGLSENPDKTLKVGNTEKTYRQWLELYQAIHVQNLKDSFAEVGKIFGSNRELAAYLRKQILRQNKYSHDLLAHLELDENGNFKYPIIDPLLRSQFDSLCASLVRNRVTKRMFRMGALPQVASWGFDKAQLRFTDRNGTLILTEEEFNKQGSNIKDINTWSDYQIYAKDNCTNLAYMEVYLPPFDINVMRNLNDAFIYKEDVYKDGKLIHRSGEFNSELFTRKCSKKLLDGIANRVPTETKHSMIPIHVKGFLPSQNSSCAVVPGEWIAISDSDNDGDKLYTYFYSSEVIYDEDKINLDYMAQGGSNLDIANRTNAYKQFVKEAKTKPEYIKEIVPKEFETIKLDRIAGENDRDYQQRVDLASIAQNGHDARNNKLLDLMISVLRTDDNTAQILIPGGFPIAKKVAMEMKELMGVKDDACSVCNPAVRTIQQTRNMAGRNLIGIYANHRSLRPLLEQAKVTLNAKNRPTINSNKSLPKYKGRLTWSMSAEKNSAGEFISDNISNFSGASVDNAKDPLLGYLGQNEVTAPIAMMLIHTGYTIKEVALFMNQPAIKECVREYMLNGRRGFLEDIVSRKTSALRKQATGATEDAAVVEEMPLDILQNAIVRDSKGILRDANDNLVQLKVMENFARILPAARALQNIITVTKADTQIGALRARSSENKLKLQTINRLQDKVTQDSYPIQGAETLVPALYSEEDIMKSPLPQVAAFRFYGLESFDGFMRDISMTFNKLIGEVHDVALDIIDGISLDKDTVDNLTNAATSYIFSGIKAFTQRSREDTVRRAVQVLNEIKQKNLIKENPLIKDLTVNVKGNKYSRMAPFIRLNRNVRKNLRAIENYRRAWESLIVNGDKVIHLSDGTITYKELSDLLFNYCFLTRGLNVGGASFIQCFPPSQVLQVEGYLDELKKLTSLRADSDLAEAILDQYVANHPEDYHLVHRVSTKNFSIQQFLDKNKVIPTTINLASINKGTAEFFKTETDAYGNEVPKAYPYLFFKDKANRRYLYKGFNTDKGIQYQRMQVLGNADHGFLEEYEQGKNVRFGDVNCVESAIGSNGNVVMTSDLANAVDKRVQDATEKGETLTQEDYRKTIEAMVGSNVEVNIVMDSYQSKKEDLTGMEFCVTL